MDRYVHLYRNKWMRIKPQRLQSGYHGAEIDKDGRLYEGYTTEFHEIILSQHCPGVLVPSHIEDMQYIQNRG